MKNPTSLGVVVNSLDAQHSHYYLINSLSQLAKTTECCAFFSTWARFPATPLFGLYQTSNLWGFSGVTISTDVTTTARMVEAAAPQKKFFYVWNLDWHKQSREYSDLYYNVYCNPDVHLIARSEWHAQRLRYFWKEPVCVMSDWDVTVLKEIINGKY